MALDLPSLRLSEREIEQLSGLEVSDRWIGSLWGGVYRVDRLQRGTDWLGLVGVELMATALLFVFTLPIGLSVVRFIPNTSNTLMLSSMGGCTVLGLVVWNRRMWRKGRSLGVFLNLLDEIDRYHQVLQTVAVLDRLTQVRGTAEQGGDRQEALQITRDCLVTGLRTERIMREQGSFLAQVDDGTTHLVQSLNVLKTLEIQDQAEEYAEILRQSLAIGARVQQELLELSQGKR